MRRLACLLVLVLTLGSLATADVRLASPFTDHMVLQRDQSIAVWGRADPGEAVAVTLAPTSGAGERREATTRADRRGHWRAALEALPTGGSLRLTVVGKNTVTCDDVLMGDVWIGSGQSNMQWPVSRSRDAQKEIAAADLPRIRLFAVQRATSGTPLDRVTGHWSVCTPETVRDFSAVAFFFGRELHRELEVPIGLIHSSWGGTPAEAWTRRERLAKNPKLRGTIARWDEVLARFPAAMKRYEKKLGAWKKRAAAAKAAGKKRPSPPRKPAGPGHSHAPAGLWNAMIAPLTPLAIRGVIWYQGESNASRAQEYRTLFPAMISDWRKQWKRGDFPFLFVQLANFRARRPQPADSDWAELREAQAAALQLPATGMATAIDIGEAKDIHPRNKQEVGRRLALQARAIAYGDKLVAGGPRFHSMRRANGELVLRFDQAPDGLAVRGDKLLGFQVAGKDRRWVWAEAIVDDKEQNVVRLRADEVRKPRHARYAWADNPAATLENREGLPAEPFRTDDWPRAEAKKRR